jgi:hypothetical protein
MLKLVFPTPLDAPFSAAKLKLLTTTIRAPRYNRIASSATLPVMRARTRAKVVNRFFALISFIFSPLQSTPMLLSFLERAYEREFLGSSHVQLFVSRVSLLPANQLFLHSFPGPFLVPVLPASCTHPGYSWYRYQSWVCLCFSHRS